MLVPRSTDGMVPPHSDEAERSVLSAILVDGSGGRLDEVVDTLKPRHFYAERHRRVYEAALALHEVGSPVDVTTVTEHLRGRTLLEAVGGAGYLVELLDGSPAIANVRTHAEIVVRLSRMRDVIATAQDIAATGYTDQSDPDAYVAQSAERLHAIAHEDARSTLEHVKTILKAEVARVTACMKAGIVSGTPTGFDRLDRLTGGLHDGDLTILAARPGCGKTSMATQMAENVASRGLVAVVFSLEMPRGQVASRMVCCRGRIDVSRVRHGTMTPLDWQRFTAATMELAKLPVWIEDQSAISLLELRAKVRRLQSELARAKEAATRIGLVVVDYLQLMRGREGAQSREQEVSELSRGLKQLAKELAVPVVALSQLNRAVETRGKDKRPQLSDLRESGAIEQDADNVIFLYREDYYDPDTENRNMAEVIVAKQRSGPTGTAMLRFDREYTRFDNLGDGYDE